MKFAYILLILLIEMVGLCACSNNNDSGRQNTATPTANADNDSATLNSVEKSIDGTWVAESETENHGEAGEPDMVKHSYTQCSLNADRTVSLHKSTVLILAFDDDSVTLNVNVEGSGSWSAEGNSLNITIDPATVSASMSEPATQNNTIQANQYDYVAKAIGQQIMTTECANLPRDYNYTIEKVDESTLTLTDNRSQKITFKRL